MKKKVDNKCINNLCEGCIGAKDIVLFWVQVELTTCQIIALQNNSNAIDDGMKSQVLQQIFDQICIKSHDEQS